jgi:hypothetical protein
MDAASSGLLGNGVSVLGLVVCCTAGCCVVNKAEARSTWLGCEEGGPEALSARWFPLARCWHQPPLGSGDPDLSHGRDGDCRDAQEPAGRTEVEGGDDDERVQQRDEREAEVV